ncbi:MAG: amidohydrolase family protein [Gemmatimonadales bacterium]|nr:amidohydrolase family protein [Gemmatimonadales bacterium]
MMLLLLAALAAPAGQAPAYDLLLSGGMVLDGTGAPPFRADVAVLDDRIAAVSRTPIPAARARRVIDAAGKTVSPGFIDLHAHNESIFQLPAAESRVRQGVTTTLAGPDGGGPTPFGAYLERADKVALGVNVGWLVGFGSVRQAVLGRSDRAPNADELDRMKRLVGQAMHEGAFGLSTGLLYVPQTYATTAEVIAVSKVAGDSGGIYTSHLRKEGLGLLDGVAEAIRIGKEAGMPVVLTHHKAIGKAMWGRSAATLAMIDSARAAGQDVMADQYPYTASSTGFNVLVPAWAFAGGDSAFARRVKDPVLRDSIAKGILDILENDRGGGDLKRVQFASVAWKRDLQGRTLYDWAVERGVSPTPRGAVDLVIEGVLNGGAGMIYHVMDEGDVQRIMKHPWTAIASDGSLSEPGVGVPHPRNYGTFPRVLGRYVRELKVLTLPEAVRKMTSLPAMRMGLTDRGRIAAGLKADLVVFDPATVGEKSTFAQPHQYPDGIPYVIVNGKIEVDDGKMTEARGGRVLRHTPQARQAPPVAFVNVNVVPMDRERVIAGQTVVTEGNKIVRIGPAASVPVPAGAIRVDGAGKYLIPGLAEMHAHVPPGNATDAEITRMLELWALNGVTTVRSMLGIPKHLPFREAAAKGEILSPRIWASGPSFSGGSVPNADSAMRMVRAEKALGYDFLKMHPGIPREAFDSLAATADRLGIRFAGHVPLAVGLERAIQAKYWTIDHLDGFLEAMARGGPPTTPQQDGFFGLPLAADLDESRLPGLVAAAKRAGVWMVPTEAFFEAIMGDEPLDQLVARPELKYVAPALVSGWTNTTRQYRENPAYPRELRQRFIAMRRKIIKTLHDGGVGIVLGSDSPQFWNAPGFSSERELGTYVAAGLTPYQALATGTRNVADFLGNAAETGTVAAGKRADLILLSGNPLADIQNVARRAGVMVAGRWIAREEIDRRLAALVP